MAGNETGRGETKETGILSGWGAEIGFYAGFVESVADVIGHAQFHVPFLAERFQVRRTFQLFLATRAPA